MSFIFRYLLTQIIFVCLPLLMVGQNQASVLKIRIRPVFGKLPLELNGRFYPLENKDSVKIKTLKFYLSNIKLETEDKNYFSENYSYHLIDAEEEETMEITLKDIGSENFVFLKCALGVDSAKNTAGILNGDLDPAKGMFWAWNTGYIAAKLEGVSPVCKTKDHEFDFHVGGYRQPFNSYREMEYKLTPRQFVKGKTTVIELLADVSVWFKNVDLQQTNHIVVPGKEAMRMADNYKEMLKLKSVSVE